MIAMASQETQWANKDVLLNSSTADYFILKSGNSPLYLLYIVFLKGFII